MQGLPRLVGLWIVLRTIALPAYGGSSPIQHDGEWILRRVEDELNVVKDFTVDLEVSADIERMNVPPMRVRMFYKQPDRFHYESESFALLPREGLAFSVSRLLSRFSIEDVKEEGSHQFTLELRPRDIRARATKLQVTIDSTHWRPTRILSSLFDGRTMSATFLYEKFGGHPMPSQLTVQFAGSTDTTESNLDDIGMWRPPLQRKGTITVKYSGYKINTGLADDIFNEK